MIRDFNMTKNLTLRRQGSNIEEVTDIGPVQENTQHLKLKIPITSSMQTLLLSNN